MLKNFIEYSDPLQCRFGHKTLLYNKLKKELREGGSYGCDTRLTSSAASYNKEALLNSYRDIFTEKSSYATPGVLLFDN